MCSTVIHPLTVGIRSEKCFVRWFCCCANVIDCILCLLDHALLWQLKNKRPTWCHLLFYFTSYVLNMFRTSIYPSSGACDYSVEYHVSHIVFGLMFVGVSVWVGWSGIHVAGWNCASVCNMDTTPTQPHRNSNTHRTKKNTTNVVFNRIVAGSWWWIYRCPKHVEHIRSEIK